MRHLPGLVILSIVLAVSACSKPRETTGELQIEQAAEVTSTTPEAAADDAATSPTSDGGRTAKGAKGANP